MIAWLRRYLSWLIQIPLMLIGLIVTAYYAMRRDRDDVA